MISNHSEHHIPNHGSTNDTNRKEKKMRTTNLLITGVIATSLLALAACGGSTTGTTGSAGLNQPAAGASGADSLKSALESMNGTTRVELADLEKACGDNKQCTSDLDTLKQKLQATCPTQAGCTDVVAMLLYNKLTPQQRQAGIIPSTFPQVAQIAAVYSALIGQPINVPGAAGGGGNSSPSGQPGSQPGGQPGASGNAAATGALSQVIADVSKSYGDINWDKIQSMIEAADPTGGKALAMQVQKALAQVPATSPSHDAAQSLGTGQAVSAAAAVAALNAAAALINP